MATKSRYLLKIHPLVRTEDIPLLPDELKVDFEEIFQPILQSDPYNCGGLSNHPLKGNLADYRALDIEWEGNSNAYKLVYRIYEKPAPKRVLVVSFAEHDPAYDKAKERAGRT